MKQLIARRPLLETAQVRGDRTSCSHLNSETSLERKICSGRGTGQDILRVTVNTSLETGCLTECQNANTGIFCWVT